LVSVWIDAFNARDVDRMLACMAADVALPPAPDRPLLPGPQGLREEMNIRPRRGFPDDHTGMDRR
jgi:ketosteroid isomerase-like protein